MLVIIIRKADRFRAFFQKTPFAYIKNKLSHGTKTVRFTMISTYIAVTLITLILMCVYIIGILSENLYSEQRIKMYAKANMISQTAAERWDAGNENLMALRFGDIIDQSLAGTNIRGVITTNSYTVIYDNNREANMAGKVFMRGVLKRALDGEQADAMLDSDTGRTITVSVPVESGGEVIGGVYLAQNVSAISDTIKTLRTSLIVFCIIIIFVIGILSIGVSYIVTQPFTKFSEVAKAVSKGDFSRRADEKGMSEVVQMGQALNYMCDELNELDEKRKNFVSDVSHELKTPMAGIKLLCDSLVEAENPDMDTVREFLGDMSEEIDRLTRLINRLLTLSRLDSGSDLALSEVDVDSLCSSVVRSLDKIAIEKGISLSFCSMQKIHCMIYADYDKLYESVYNVVENAIKYTPDGGRVTVSVTRGDGVCIIETEDTGPGIPDEGKNKIFERFYRLDDSRARDTGGTGLGLAIAREAIQLHNGSITVRDAVAGGSVFVISLPMRKE